MPSEPEVVHHLKVIVHPFFKALSSEVSFLLSRDAREKLPRRKPQPSFAVEPALLERVTAHYTREIEEASAQEHSVAVLRIPTEQFESARALCKNPAERNRIDCVEKTHNAFLECAVARLGKRAVVVEPNEAIVPLRDQLGGAGKTIKTKLAERGLCLAERAEIEVFGENRRVCVALVKNSFPKETRASVAEEKCP